MRTGIQQPGRVWAGLGMFALSGAAALGYQAVWVRLLGAGLGHEMPALLGVVAAVMAGMGLGAWALDRSVCTRGHPAAWYAGLEIVIGVWGAASACAMPWLNARMSVWMGVNPAPAWQWTVAFAVPLVVLFPATAAMGATLPAMERWLSRGLAAGRCVGAVYAANVLGAAAGTWASVWVLIPALGLRGAAFALAAANLACAAVIWALARIGTNATSERDRAAGTAREASRLPVRAGLGLAAACGFLGLAYETLSVRVLSQVLDGTVYTYSSVLAVFLLGTAAGSGLYQRLGGRGRLGFARGLRGLLLGLGGSCVWGIAALSLAAQIYDGLLTLTGGRAAGVLTAEALTSAAVLLPPTLLMGAVFASLAEALRSEDGGVGRVAGVNTLAAALAPAAWGVVALPLWGPAWSLAALAAGYVLLAAFAGRTDSHRVARASAARVWAGGCGIVVAAAWAAGWADLRLVKVPPGAAVRAFVPGALGFVAVVSEADGQRTLRVDNHFQMGGTSATEAQARQAHLPLLLHPAPRTGLFLGLGTGITAGAASLHPGLEIDAVELVPEVLTVLPWFAPENRSVQRLPAVRLHVADARRYVRATPRRYDVIVADLFHPARDGAGFLYTREHFAALRGRLQPGGLVCQWLPLHQLDEASLRIVVRTFLEVFPAAEAWCLWFNVDVPVLGLVGTDAGTGPSPADPARASSSSGLLEELRRFGLGDRLRLAGHRLAGAPALRAFAGEAVVATDDRPALIFTAPRLRYHPDARPYGRLLALLDAVQTSSADGRATASGDEAVERFRSARDEFLRGLVAEAEGREAEAVDRYVASAARSVDFTAGYAQCLSRIAVLQASNPGAAWRLAERLVEAQPAIPVGRQLLERWSAP